MAESKRRILVHFPLDGLRWIEEEFPQVELVAIPEEGPLPSDLEGDILFTSTWGSPNLEDILSRGVRWIHTVGTGIDRFPLDALGDRVLTCARGASAVPIAEWTLAVMLAFEKQLPDRWLSKPPARWNWAQLGGLDGRTLALLGLGGIGVAVATRALAFGMSVKAVRRSEQPSPVAGVEIVSDAASLVADADHLVVAAPLTHRTRGIVDAELLRLAKPGLHLVNVSRGELVDQEALLEALEAGHVARASLDVATPEPLPEEHWLYGHPGVRLSAHVSWSMPGCVDLLMQNFAANLRRYLEGKPLEGIVDVEEGY